MTEPKKPPIVVVSERLDSLEGREVTYRKATVVATNPGLRTIDVDVDNAGKLEGLRILSGSFFPHVGDQGEIRLQGSRVSWVVNRLAPDSVGEEELDTNITYSIDKAKSDATQAVADAQAAAAAAEAAETAALGLSAEVATAQAAADQAAADAQAALEAAQASTDVSAVQAAADAAQAAADAAQAAADEAGTAAAAADAKAAQAAADAAQAIADAAAAGQDATAAGSAAAQAVADAAAAYQVAEEAEAAAGALTAQVAAAQVAADDANAAAQEALDKALQAGTDVTAVQAAADAAQDAADAAQAAANSAGTLAAQADATAAQAAADAAQALADAAAAMAAAGDAASLAATALTAANDRNRVTYSVNAPTSATPGVVVGDAWWRFNEITGTLIGSWRWTGSAWVSHKFGDQVLDSLSAAKIVTGVLGVGVQVTVGDVARPHTVIDGTRGLIIQAPDAAGVQRELNRYGREVSIIDPVTGEFLASIDDTGQGNFTKVSTADLVVAGKNFLQILDDGPRGIVARFRKSLSAALGPIFFPIGIAEFGAMLYAGRAYKFTWSVPGYGQNDDAQAQYALRITAGASGTTTQPPAPTVDTPAHVYWDHFLGPTMNKADRQGGSIIFNATTTARRRFGLTAALGPDSALSNVWIATKPIEMTIEDVGPAVPDSGSFTTMGGSLNNGAVTPPPPTHVAQQYFVDLAPAGRRSWTGSGAHMNWVGNDVYQGYSPYGGSNGNTRGQFWFDLPPITGTVDRADFWGYSRHWHYNSGGTMILGITDQRGIFTGHTFRGLWHTSGWPKPGGKEVLLPADWWPLFRGTDNNSYNGRGTCLTLGPGVGTDPLYYGVFTDARLRIYYTQ